MLSPLPRHSVWVQVFAHFPRRISLPRIGCQVGLRNVLLEACSAFIHITACTLAKSPSDPLHRRLQPLRCLHDCFDCFRLERKLPGGTLTHWKTPPYHGARRKRTFKHNVVHPRIAPARVPPDWLEADFDHPYLNESEEAGPVPELEFDQTLSW